MDTSSLIAGGGITRQFGSFGSNLQFDQDEYGFLVPSPGLFGIDNLLEASAIVVRGRPWMGKTYLAKEIWNQQSDLSLGEHVWELPLHLHTSGRSIEPAGWTQWRDGQDRACWIIDSLDEGELLQRNLCTEITGRLDNVGATARQRLKVLIFGRETEIPDHLVESLSKLYGDDFRDVELMPLDIDNARRMVSKQDFEEVLSVILSRNLQGVCSIPAALKYISEHKDDANLSEVAVWKGILESLLLEKATTEARKTLPRCELDQLFRAAARVAVFFTFCGLDRLGNETSTTSEPSLGQLIKADVRPGEPSIAAARNAMKTEMFLGRRFVQKNVREWMCAFGLKDCALGRLRSLVTDENGGLRRDHWGVLSLLAKIGKTDVKEWICRKNGGVPPRSDLSSLTLAEALETIDRLEKIAETTTWKVNLWGNRGLDQLKVAGIGEILAKRLEDAGRSVKQRDLLLQIAIHTDSREVLPAARAIVEDTGNDEDFRYSALVPLMRFGEKDELRQLAGFVQQTRPRTPGEKKIVSAIIWRYLETGFWDVEQAIKYAPAPEGGTVDSTAVLAHRLREHMNVTAARIYIKRNLSRLARRRASKGGRAQGGERRDNELLIRAAGCLLAQEPANESDLRLLLPLDELRHQDGYAFLDQLDFSAGFAKSATLRRELYLRVLDCPPSDRASWRYRQLRQRMAPDDIDWLIQQLPRLAEKDEEVWDDLLIIAFSRKTPPSLRRRAKSFVQKMNSARFEKFKERRTKWANEERHRKKERNEIEGRHGERTYPIGEVVENLLKSNKVTPQIRMWRLSWICFSDDQERPRNVQGKWEDLSPPIQSRVLDACEYALRTCDSTPLPDGSSFPSTILYEAWCFRKILADRRKSFPLDGALIKRWLPSMFVVSINGEDHVLATCYETEITATEDVCIEAIAREVRSGSEHMIRANNLADEYWSERVVSFVANLISDDNLNVLPRAELLRVLAGRSPVSALPLARRISATATYDRLWYAATDALVALEPECAWPYVRAAFGKEGKGALIQLPSLHQHGIQAGMQLSSWPPDRLVDLARMLHQAFPRKDDPEERDGWVTAESEFRDLRAGIPRVLFQRGPGDDRRALEELVAEFDYLHDWLEHAKAEEAAHGEIARVSAIVPGARPLTGVLPLQTVVELLDNADYRVVRHEDDLVEVVEELLQKISAEVGEHIEMLYCGINTKKGPRPQHESALQGYVHSRLRDLLPRRILDEGTKVSLHRESQGRFRQRTDIEIVAPLVHGGLGTLVIEVKWSHNREISVAQTGQLGTDYLLASGKTHGIYLVGWCGKLAPWKKTGGHRPKRPVTPQSLETALQAQATEFCSRHDGMDIRPVVFDLEWRHRN